MVIVTWKPQTTGITISNEGLTVRSTSSSYSTIAMDSKTKGKWYWEVKVSDVYPLVGVTNITSGSGIYTSTNHMGYYSDGKKWNGSSGVSYGATFVANDIISVLLDLDNGNLEFWKNGVSQGVAFTTVKNLGTVYPSHTSGSTSTSSTVTANFGASQFVYEMPKGYYSYDGSQSSFDYKTFILHNGEYKKIVNIPRTLENAIPIMTSNTSPSGIASASSVYNKSVQYEAFKAFDNLNDSNGWISYDNSYPQWLSYEFAEPIIISKYSILCRIATPTASPKDWTFEGSNDGVTWYELDTRVGFTDWVANIFNEFSFENNKEYSKYRIKISSNNGYASYSAISEMKMSKEITPSQTFWESISTTLPTVEQFVSDGMSDLSVLDRKSEKETIAMNDDINSGAGEVLGNGMVFKKKIDLKKYFDITNLEIK